MRYAFNNCTFDKPDELENAPNHHYIITGDFKIYTMNGEELIKDYSVKVKAKDVFRYHQGDLVQDCFPYLSIKEREFLISGMYWDTNPEDWVAVSFDGDTGPNNPDDGSWEGR